MFDDLVKRMTASSVSGYKSRMAYTGHMLPLVLHQGELVSKVKITTIHATRQKAGETLSSGGVNHHSVCFNLSEFLKKFTIHH